MTPLETVDHVDRRAEQRHDNGGVVDAPIALCLHRADNITAVLSGAFGAAPDAMRLDSVTDAVRILDKSRVDTALREWSQGLVGDKTLQQLTEEFAGITVYLDADDDGVKDAGEQRAEADGERQDDEKEGETAELHRRCRPPRSVLGLFDDALERRGSTFSFTFDKAGTYEYFCRVHASMTGAITVE